VTCSQQSSLYYLPLRKKYRSHFEIIALLLEAVKGDGAPRFSIMRQAGINCVQLKKYLGSLHELGFLEKELRDGRVLYRASDKGLEFLKQYYVLLTMLLNTYADNRLPQPEKGIVHVLPRQFMM
jgi:predicted transcriptional regulator